MKRQPHKQAKNDLIMLAALLWSGAVACLVVLQALSAVNLIS